MSRPRTLADGQVRDAVQAAVSASHYSRPLAGAPARDQAVWWARTAGALNLISGHEADPARAEAAHADAVTARRLATGMASAHAAQLTRADPTAEVDSVTCQDWLPELADTTEPELAQLDVLEVGL